MTRAQKRNLVERCHVFELLEVEPPDPVTMQRIRRLDDLDGEALVLETDRVLRIVGLRLVQEGLSNLFEQVYAAVFDGDVDVGDGQIFLRAQMGPD